MAADAATIDRLGREVFEFDELKLTDPESVDPGEDTVQGVVSRLLHEARKFYEEELEPEQVEATDYYHGRLFGDEREGRSKVVSTDVRDVTLGQLPDLIQLFMGPDRMVEFAPRNERQVETAEQQTDYLNHVIWEDNPGFATILGWLQDGLVRSIGVVRWWWEERERLVEDQYTGLSYGQLLQLASDEHIDDFEIDAVYYNPEWDTDEFDVTVKRWTTGGIARFEGVPNEEFLFTPDARSLDKSQVVAHSRTVPADEVVAMGYAYADIEPFIGRVERTGSEDLQQARQFYGGNGRRNSEEGDEVRRDVLLTEAYVWVDTDGDDIGELRRFYCIGPNYKILPDPDTGSEDGVAVERVPFAVFTPYPEPHTIVGLCNYHLLKDIQRIKSQIKRGMLDSLAQAIDAQQEVVASEVNMKDLVKPDVSRIVRVRRPGMIREVKHTFVGGECITTLEYMDEVRAERTGRTRASEGLDPDSLQSSTREAVHATLGKNQARVYMIAQVFAETALKPLMQGLHELIVKHQDYARMVRLRGKFVEVDPRQWDTSLDLKVNVALGMGTPMERAAILGELIARQEKYLEAGVPFMKFTHLRRSLERATKLLGFQDPSEFFGTWGDAEQAAYEQALASNPPRDPAQEVVETERMKLQQDHIFRMRELELKEAEMHLRDQREREKAQLEARLRELELELEFRKEIQVRPAVEMAKAEVQADTQREVAAQRATEPRSAA